MTHTIVQFVEKWYAENSRVLSSVWAILRIRSKEPADTAKGKVVIEFENPRVLGSITFWNDRSVTALAVDKGSGAERILDDRRCDVAESVPTLLEGYFRELSGIEGKTSD